MHAEKKEKIRIYANFQELNVLALVNFRPIILGTSKNLTLV